MRSGAQLWRVLLPVLAFCLPVAGADLQVRWNGARVTVASPGLHFLSGRAFDRLRDGATVNFDIQVSVLNDTRSVAAARSVDRFVVSYDLWEEKFAAVQASSRRKPPGLLSAAELEAWCVENVSVPTAGLIGIKRYVAKLEVRVAPAIEEASNVSPNTLISRLIELFSAPAHGGQQGLAVESHPFRLLDLQSGLIKGSP